MPLLTTAELRERTGFPERTIRRYVDLELISPPVGFNRWSDEHLRQLGIIAEIKQGSRMPMDKLRHELAVRLAATTATTAEQAAPKSSAPAPRGLRRRWEHVELVPGLVLLVKEGAGDVVARLAREIEQKYGIAAD